MRDRPPCTDGLNPRRLANGKAMWPTPMRSRSVRNAIYRAKMLVRAILVDLANRRPETARPEPLFDDFGPADTLRAAPVAATTASQAGAPPRSNSSPAVARERLPLVAVAVRVDPGVT
jgi:hypothetical protein